MLNSNKGKIGLLDLIILFLCIAVIASLVLPKLQEKKEEEALELSRLRIQAYTEAEFNYFRSAFAPTDSAEMDQPYPRVYTASFDSLKPYLPEWAEQADIKPICPVTQSELFIMARDSLFFVIGSKAGPGYSVMGKFSWE